MHTGKLSYIIKSNINYYISMHIIMVSLFAALISRIGIHDLFRT